MPNQYEQTDLRSIPELKTYENVIEYLNSLGLFHMDMKLDRMKHALSKLDITKFPCSVVQVVGTNGKGSTATFLASLAKAHGMSYGLFTSPHFVRPEERIVFNGTPLPPEKWPKLAEQALKAEPNLTYFELVTVMAALYFCECKPDILIFEAGLGGRYDATTALPVDAVIFTPFAMDHMNILGETIEAIGDDKSDALRKGVRFCFSAVQQKSVMDIIKSKAMRHNISLFSLVNAPSMCAENDNAITIWKSIPEELKLSALPFSQGTLGLHGRHQVFNAQLAILAWVILCHHCKRETDLMHISEGLKNAFIPGRLQFVPEEKDRPALWLDGAHNEHGMKALRDAVLSFPQDKQPRAVVFSCLADKEPEKVVSILKQFTLGCPIFIPTIEDNPRAADNTFLAKLIGENAISVNSLDEALFRAYTASGRDPVLICGSLYLLSEFYAKHEELLYPYKNKLT